MGREEEDIVFYSSTTTYTTCFGKGRQCESLNLKPHPFLGREVKGQMPCGQW